MDARCVVFSVFGALIGCTTPAVPQAPTTAAPAQVETPAPPAPDPDRVLLAADERGPKLLTVNVGCSETELRMPVARVTWPRSIEAEQRGQRLDTTVYKEGFERDWYAWVPTDRGGKFELEPALREMLAKDDGGQAFRPFDMVARPDKPDNEKEQGLAVMEVRNLEPGVLYRWRLRNRLTEGWMPSETVTVEAPVCVADMVREER